MTNLPQEICLSVRNLSIYLGKAAAVESLSFDLYRGKTLAIVGESGSGKSMTALSIMRILPTPPVTKVEGEILFNNANLLMLKEKEMRAIRGGKIGMIFQDPHSALNPVFRVGYQLVESVEIHQGLFGEEAQYAAIQALEEVGIERASECFSAYPHELSGGMKQRVMIAMALLGKPEILIADEPTTALDVTIQKQVLELMQELQRKWGMAILLITHDMGVVAKIAHRCLVMYAAQEMEQASCQAIFESSTHPYTQALLRARPSYLIARGKLEAIPGNPPTLDQFPPGCKFHPRCPFVMPKCRQGAVPLFQDPHPSRCWLLEGQCSLK